jgi:hypothetical protein
VRTPPGFAPGAPTRRRNKKTFSCCRLATYPRTLRAMTFQVCPRLLVDPPMWTVEIRDAATDSLLWSSWANEWIAYHTVEEARDRAHEMIKRLAASQPSAA